MVSIGDDLLDAGAVGLGDPVPGDIHGNIHSVRGGLPAE